MPLIIFSDLYKVKRSKEVAYRIEKVTERMLKNGIRIYRKGFDAYEKALMGIDADIAKDLETLKPLPAEDTFVKRAISSNTYVCGIRHKNGKKEKCAEHFVASYDSKYDVENNTFFVVNISIAR